MEKLSNLQKYIYQLGLISWSFIGFYFVIAIIMTAFDTPPKFLQPSFSLEKNLVVKVQYEDLSSEELLQRCQCKPIGVK
jgi:hypothetical protein